ncbi:hypothetical protein M8C21_029678, partial [Ambrosia artemisiifolia]
MKTPHPESSIKRTSENFIEFLIFFFWFTFQFSRYIVETSPTTCHTKRRFHQMMFAVHDYDRTPVGSWFLPYRCLSTKVMNPFFTQRTKSKFVFVVPSKTTELQASVMPYFSSFCEQAYLVLQIYNNL